jgi:hypothetical protein
MEWKYEDPRPTMWHNIRIQLRNRRYILLDGAALAVIVVACLTILTVRHSDSTSLHQVAQPATALQIAEKVGCTNFQDRGPSQAGGSIDGGTCYIGSQKYGINTFASKDVRDAWLKLAERLGVSPKWETETSVVYPSTQT